MVINTLTSAGCFTEQKLKLQSPKQEQNSKRPMSSSQRKEETSTPETLQNWPNSQPDHRRVKLQ